MAIQWSFPLRWIVLSYNHPCPNDGTTKHYKFATSCSHDRLFNDTWFTLTTFCGESTFNRHRQWRPKRWWQLLQQKFLLLFSSFLSSVNSRFSIGGTRWIAKWRKARFQYTCHRRLDRQHRQKYFKKIGPWWWWSSGQRARLLLRRSELDYHWGLLQFFCKICVLKRKKRPGWLICQRLKL